MGTGRSSIVDLREKEKTAPHRRVFLKRSALLARFPEKANGKSNK
jgi:hypothetical protein